MFKEKIENNNIKGARRAKQRFNKKRKRIKHGEGAWQKQVHLQNIGLSRYWKKKIGVKKRKSK